jgi:hypothetical protein
VPPRAKRESEGNYNAYLSWATDQSACWRREGLGGFGMREEGITYWSTPKAVAFCVQLQGVSGDPAFWFFRPAPHLPARTDDLFVTRIQISKGNWAGLAEARERRAAIGSPDAWPSFV